MQFLRFSLQSVLVTIAVAAALLYQGYMRPVAVAKQYIFDVENDSRVVRLIDGHSKEGAFIDGHLKERTFMDLLECRQNFVITMVRHKQSVGMPVENCTYYNFHATPFGVHLEASREIK